MKLLKSLALAAAFVAAPAMAHHSFAQFDMAKTQTLSGTVRTVEWANPHVWIWINIKGPDGATQPWGFEGASPGELMRWQFPKDTLKVGDKVTVIFHPARAGKNGGSFLQFILPNGKRVGPPAPPKS